ncbi:PREDICTED: uncharacterized protein LOC18612541 [Theobroma cacao]|uniref:Uncharacterized protein LOC18612541 n=1 Tax=Theobroma cacao TaxID=3641 RepID=A0AB32VQM9_THECC|nr:PREDICTED: uncharacterized protein LOC18612541 [Theobroma cacao]XP_007049459.2 PREDICTED: uncharacterized protein LOC18612541 [Theobroma cacao]
MGTKSRGVKSRPCNSIPPSNPSLISPPLLHQDEANEEYRVDGTDCGASEGAGSSQDNDNNDDDVVVPDSVEEVDRCAGENHGAGPSRECIFVDWLEQESCIRCNSRTGQVLVCSENGCPVTIHEVCMNCNPKFDNMGKFYCPYCWYKRELVRTKELRRKAMLARKELSNFICLKRDGGNEEMQVDETETMKAASVSTMAGKINTGDSENGLNDKNNERIHHDQEETPGVESISKSDEERNSRARGSENFGDGERIQDEDIENASDSEDDEIDEDQWQIQPISSSHLEIEKGALPVSTKETSDNVGVLEENKEEPVLPNAVGTTMALITSDATSKVPAIKSFEFVLPDLNTETLVVRQKRVKRTAQKEWPQKVDSPKMPSSEPSTSAKDKKMNQQGKATAAKNSVQCQELNKRFVSSKLGTEKRRRLHWTAEEEEMLKEGVRRFSSIVNKNIPWRKILEFGHHVFHSTRTPVDLKDKWKNIIAKEAPK